MTKRYHHAAKTLKYLQYRFRLRRNNCSSHCQQHIVSCSGSIEVQWLGALWLELELWLELLSDLEKGKAREYDKFHFSQFHDEIFTMVSS